MHGAAKIALTALVALTGLGGAYFAGAHFARDEPAPSPVRGELADADFAASMEGVDYGRLVETIAAVRSTDQGTALPQFHGTVDTLHKAVLGYIADRLRLTDDERALMMKEYAASSGSILMNYQQMMGVTAADSMTTPSEAVVTYQAYDSVNDFVGVFSGHACSLLSFPGRAQLKQASGLVEQEEVKGAMNVRLTCENILAEAIGPIAQSLREKAIISDLNTSRMNIESRVRSMVVELATAEESMAADFTDIYQTKFLFLKSEAALQARAESTVKVGFNLNRRFSVEMNHDDRRLTIRLPEPEVLSNEVDVKFIDVKNGTFVRIDREKYNAALVHAREMMSDQVAGSDIFIAAKHNARRIIETIFQPMMALPEYQYDVDVRFPYGYRTPPVEPAAVPEPVIETAG